MVETRHELSLGPPKNRRRRTTMYPAHTPEGLDLAALVERRLGELGPEPLVFPRPGDTGPGGPTTEPAARSAGWPRTAEGRWAWTFHSLRHVFAWALAQPGRASRTCPGCSGTPPCGSPRTPTSPLTGTSSSGSTGRRRDTFVSDRTFALVDTSQELPGSGATIGLSCFPHVFPHRVRFPQLSPRVSDP